MTAEAQAATTEAQVVEADAQAIESPGADSAPAVNDADESKNRNAKSGYSERIDELTRNWRETERELERERRERRELEREFYGKREERREQPSEDQGELKTLADFAYDERAYGRYVQQVARDTAKRELESFREESQKSQAQQKREAARTQFFERATSWAKEQKVEDIDRMFADPRDGGPVVSEVMADTIMESDVGPALLNYLTKNRTQATQISRMTPIQQARELGRLEAKLANAPAPKVVSGAPPPAPRIDGSGTAGSGSVKADSPDSDDLSDADWAKARKRQIAARDAARKRS